MMQDATHIRSLEGNQRLVSWVNKDNGDNKEKNKMTNTNNFEINKDTIIGDIIDKYPYIKEFMPTISEKYELLLNPVMFNTMGKIATLSMVAARGEIEVDVLIEKITNKIKEEESK